MNGISIGKIIISMLVILVLSPIIYAIFMGWMMMWRDLLCPSWLTSGVTYARRDWAFWSWMIR
jgi:hypothetical protein